MCLVAQYPAARWYAKLVAVAVAAYALSTIGLIPDFVPVLGCLDDLVIVPAGLALMVRKGFLDGCRMRPVILLEKPPVGGSA